MELKLNGIICDNANCDYKDETVTFEEIDKFLNKPCPKCGENLLTEQDLHNFKIVIKSFELAELITKDQPVDKNEPMVCIIFDTHKDISIRSIKPLDK